MRNRGQQRTVRKVRQGSKAFSAWQRWAAVGGPAAAWGGGQGWATYHAAFLRSLCCSLCPRQRRGACAQTRANVRERGFATRAPFFRWILTEGGSCSPSWPLTNLVLAGANDGGCDDGGSGYLHSDCPHGSDCTDCGERCEPPSAPPLPPGYFSKIASLCTEACYYDDDGACDDGGTGSSYADCSYGSDCIDCGTRSDPSLALCTSCPLECNNKGAADRDTSNWCLEAAWGANGVCDPACNNAECDHDGSDCTLSQALDECKPLQAAQGAALVTVAGSKANVEFNIIQMEPFNVALDDTTNQWKMEIEMTISLRWSDSRLLTAECRKKLNEMLSFDSDATAQTREELEANRALLYMPSFEVNKTTMTYLNDMIADPGAVRNEVTSAKFDFTSGNSSRPWMGEGAAPDGSVECIDCVEQTLTFTRAIAIVPSLSFATYPFDTQEFQVR